MVITKDNLCEVIFENQDAKLLIEDVATNTSACLYYYHDIIITVEVALKIWYRATKADDEGVSYTVSFFDYLEKKDVDNIILSQQITKERVSATA